jgi:plastocyanin
MKPGLPAALVFCVFALGTWAAVTAAATPSHGSTSRVSAIALQLTADPSGKLRFNRVKLNAKAGRIRITLTNHSPVLHNLAVRRGPICHYDQRCAGLTQFDIDSTSPFMGGIRTLTLNLKPGTYIFFCGVPGHEAAGMQGTLTVSP